MNKPNGKTKPEKKPEQQERTKLYPCDVANQFIAQSKKKGVGILIFWRNSFWAYNGRFYSRKSKPEIDTLLLRFVRDRLALKGEAKQNFVSEVAFNLSATCRIPDSLEPPLEITDSGFKPLENHMVLKNGVVDINSVLATKAVVTMNHNPKYFFISGLNYEYDSEVDCPTFESCLETILPDEGMRHLLQQWAGYNLIQDTSQQRMMLFLGNGGNGKSMVCQVLRCLLGHDNVSSLSLDAFTSRRTFPLAHTVGKLANICEDLSDTNGHSEGILKQFVSGDRLTVEEKMKPAFDMTPTARLTFASNQMPNISDTSDGVWRRFMIIPFKRKIPENMRRKELTDPKFWIKGGEIKGVLNWAIDGLFDLLEKGSFTIPDECAELVRTSKMDANPVATFLDEFYCFNTSAYRNHKITKKRLYAHYKQYAEEFGFPRLNAHRFTAEVKKHYPDVEYSEQPLYNSSDQKRERVWYGIIPISEKPPSITDDLPF